MMTYARCTGCGFLVCPGPYFRRRMIRHLRLLFHPPHTTIELQKVYTLSDYRK